MIPLFPLLLERPTPFAVHTRQTVPRFVGVFLGQVFGHLVDDVSDFAGVFFDASALLDVKVRLHGFAQHDLRQHVAQPVSRRRLVVSQTIVCNSACPPWET